MLFPDEIIPLILPFSISAYGLVILSRGETLLLLAVVTPGKRELVDRGNLVEGRQKP